MKKITHLLYSGMGGTSNVVFNIARENRLNNYKWIDSIIFTGEYLFKDNINYVKKNKLRFYFNRTIRFFSFLNWINVFLKLLNLKPDIVFVHNFDILPAAFYKFFCKKKIIFIDHLSIIYKKNLKLLFVNFLAILFADKIVTINKDNYNFFKKKIKKSNLYLIFNGIEILNLKKKINSKKNFSIGMASRVNHQKQHSIILDALSDNKLSNLNIKCYFAGDGEMLSYIKNKTKKLRLSKKVFFLGLLGEKQLRNFFLKLDLYVHASKGEGLPISILQAINFNLPVLGSKVPGIRELFKNKKIGDTFKNKKDLTDKIYHYYFTASKIKKKDEIERKNFLKRHFSSKVMYRKYLTLVNSL